MFGSASHTAVTHVFGASEQPVRSPRPRVTLRDIPASRCSFGVLFVFYRLRPEADPRPMDAPVAAPVRGEVHCFGRTGSRRQAKPPQLGPTESQREPILPSSPIGRRIARDSTALLLTGMARVATKASVLSE